MLLKTRNDREVEVDFQFESYPEDSFICHAIYTDNDELVDANVLDELNDDNQDLIQSEWNEYAIGRADWELDRIRDNEMDLASDQTENE